MNTKFILFLSCVAAVTLAAPAVNAGSHGGGGRGGHFSSTGRGGSTFMSGGSRTFTRSGSGTWGGQRWSGQRWSGGNWSGNWRHHHHNNNDVIFIGDFGFPWWGWGYPYGYGYGYPYGYGYDYGYPYGYGYGYDSNYYDGDDYGYRYGNRSRGRSSVAEVQRQLARAGYYHGSVDGIMGPQTRRAIRAYERNHNQGEYGMNDR